MTRSDLLARGCAAALVLAAAVLALPAQAQSMPQAPSTATAASPRLYDELGGQPGVARLGSELVRRAIADPRLAPYFKDAKADRLAAQLSDQICQLAGGPCTYKGADMKAAHADMEIDRRAFNALVEVLQDTLDAQAVPFAAQRRLLALLAPMHRDVVTVR